MKYVWLLTGVLASLSAAAQTNASDSVFNICDTQAIRNCGNRIHYIELDKKKLKHDLKMIDRVQSFFMNADTTFIAGFSKDLSHLELRLVKKDSVFRKEIVYCNYFRITVNILIAGNSVVKGMNIDHSKTFYCTFEKDRYSAYIFDSRWGTGATICKRYADGNWDLWIR